MVPATHIHIKTYRVCVGCTYHSPGINVLRPCLELPSKVWGESAVLVGKLYHPLHPSRGQTPAVGRCHGENLQSCELQAFVNNIWLVVWNIFFPINIGNVIIPIDFHIFQRGGPTTNQISSIVVTIHTH